MVSTSWSCREYLGLIMLTIAATPVAAAPPAAITQSANPKVANWSSFSCVFSPTKYQAEIEPEVQSICGTLGIII